MSPLPFRILALPFLLWVLALRASLVLTHAGAPFLERVGYVSLDLAFAAGCLLVAGVLYHELRWVRQLAAAAWLGLVLLAYGIAWGAFRKTGTLLDAETLLMVIANWRDLRMVIGSEIGGVDYLVFGVPALVLVLPILALPFRWRRSGRGGGGASTSTATSTAIPWRRRLLLPVAGLGTFVLLALLTIPSSPRWPQLSVSMLRPLLPVGAWEPQPAYGAVKETTEVAGIPKTTFEMPDPRHLEEAWHRRRPNAPRPNFLFVIMESVRASATSPYPPHLPTTPFLAELASQGLCFEQAYAHAPHTSKALSAMFGGHAPECQSGPSEVGRQAVVPVPVQLQNLGYRTAFFDPSTLLFEHRRLLYEQLGFHHVVGLEDMDQERFERISYLGLDDRAVIPPMLDWLGKEREKPFCAGYLTLVTHHDYRLPRGHEPTKFEVAQPPPARDNFQAYLNTVRYSDQVMRELFEGLEKLGLLDNTVVFVVGDHGDGFGEHGRHQHADNLWQEAMHVPLLVSGPRELLGPPRRVSGIRQQMDIAATVADIVGVPGMRGTGSACIGVSLLAAGNPTRRIFMRSHVPNSLLAMVMGRYKTIYHQRFDRLERYDFLRDPAEEQDLRHLLSGPNQSLLRGQMLGFVDSVNLWFQRGDKRREAAVVQSTVPKMSHRLDADYGSKGELRLLGIDCGKQSLALDGYLKTSLVFRVEADGASNYDVRVRFRRGEEEVPADSVSVQRHLWCSHLQPGSILVIPQFHLLRSENVSPGPVDVTVDLVERSGTRLPVRCAAAWPRVELRSR